MQCRSIELRPQNDIANDGTPLGFNVINSVRNPKESLFIMVSHPTGHRKSAAEVDIHEYREEKGMMAMGARSAHTGRDPQPIQQHVVHPNTKSRNAVSALGIYFDEKTLGQLLQSKAVSSQNILTENTHTSSTNKLKLDTLTDLDQGSMKIVRKDSIEEDVTVSKNQCARRNDTTP